jgi:hypothetical protein
MACKKGETYLPTLDLNVKWYNDIYYIVLHLCSIGCYLLIYITYKLKLHISMKLALEVEMHSLTK